MVPVLSATPGATLWAGPALGEHTDEVRDQVQIQRQD
jgi:crotonobetainyl-CoA:carnitine CoA-transferase CaiB-like acyl-CoA transferase